LALLDGTRHLQGCTPDLMLVVDHLDAAPDRQKNGIDHVVGSSLDRHHEDLKKQTAQAWQHCVEEHVDTYS
jgi:hypothetical protein